MPLPAKVRREFFGRKWRTVVKPELLKRAGGRFDDSGQYLGGARCEDCGKPDLTQVLTVTWTDPETEKRRMIWRYLSGGYWRNEQGAFSSWKPPELPKRPKEGNGVRTIYVVLAGSHLNHTWGDDQPENLRLRCQWCHHAHDKSRKAEHAAETRKGRKDADRDLLAVPDI